MSNENKKLTLAVIFGGVSSNMILAAFQLRALFQILIIINIM